MVAMSVQLKNRNATIVLLVIYAVTLRVTHPVVGKRHHWRILRENQADLCSRIGNTLRQFNPIFSQPSLNADVLSQFAAPP